MNIKKWFTWFTGRGLNGSSRPETSQTPGSRQPEAKIEMKGFPLNPFFAPENSFPFSSHQPVPEQPEIVEDLPDAPSDPMVFHAGNSHSPAALAIYLENRGNPPGEIARLESIFGMEAVILEVGCGKAEIALEIARKNPSLGVIATDIYAFPREGESSFGYGDASLAWKDGRLEAQETPLANLVVLRAEIDILRLLPYRSVTTLLLVNPEPKVGKFLLEFIEKNRLFETLKPGVRQIVIKPFSREMGVMSCGGFEFDHSPDYSRGLGFIMDSPFDFRRGDSIQWSVNLGAASPYSKNSTQSTVSICGGLDTDTTLLFKPPCAAPFTPGNLFGPGKRK